MLIASGGLLAAPTVGLRRETAIRKIFLLGLAAVMLSALWGCAGEVPQAQTSASTTDQSTSTETEITSTEYTTREITTILDTSDALVHAIVAGKNYRFPVINLDFPEAARINAEVWAVYEEQMHRLEQSWTPDDRDDFYHAVHGDVISLIFCRASDYGVVEYQIYHMNVKTGQPVTNKALLKQAGIKEKELTESLRRKIVLFYDGYNTAYNYNINYEDYDEFFRDFDFDRLPDDLDLLAEEYKLSGKQPRIPDFHISFFRAKALAALNDTESLRLYWSGQGKLIAVTELDFGGGADSYEVLMDSALPDEAYSRENHWLKGSWDMLA